MQICDLSAKRNKLGKGMTDITEQKFNVCPCYQFTGVQFMLCAAFLKINPFLK